MGFLKWMESRPRIVRLLLCFVMGWRAYGIVRAVFERQSLTKPIVLAVFGYFVNIADFFKILFTGRPVGVKDLEAGKVVDA